MFVFESCSCLKLSYAHAVGVQKQTWTPRWVKKTPADSTLYPLYGVDVIMSSAFHLRSLALFEVVSFLHLFVEHPVVRAPLVHFVPWSIPRPISNRNLATVPGVVIPRRARSRTDHGRNTYEMLLDVYGATHYVLLDVYSATH